MSQQRPERPAPPDPAQVAAKIAEFEALELRDPVEYAETLVTNIMEPDPVETAAFRSDQLAYKSFVATRYLIENARQVHARRRRGSQKQQATEAFIMKIGRERRILENIVNGIRARDGLLPNAPNPRRRAERRLWSEAMKGPVPAGRWRALLEEEQERDRARKREQKKARQAERRAQQR